MDLLCYYSSRLSTNKSYNRFCCSTSRGQSSRVRSSLPFPPENAKYHRELEAAVNVVEKSCRLCVDVQKSLFGRDGKILEKIDQTPVTVADFGVQALISLELGRLFPSIPLVAEEDSTSLRSTPLPQAVLSAVIDKSSPGDELLTQDDVLEAIDRGGKDAFAFGTKPATYWLLDPIDGTKGFLKGGEALYVVGLALVVEGEIVLGVMGCPNWEGKFAKDHEDRTRSGIIMVAHIGCGTWTKSRSDMLGGRVEVHSHWLKCFVDKCSLVDEAYFCIPDSQTWESLPLSRLFSPTTNIDSAEDRQVILLPRCCGSLCKYLMVASGKASIFILRARTQTVIKAWDHAVGVICVQEAGGQVTDWKGSQLDLAADEHERRVIFPSGGVLVTYGNLHKQILDIISVS